MPILELNADESAMRRIVRAIAAALSWPGRRSGNQPPPEREELVGRGRSQAESCPTNTVRQRLTDEMFSLARLDAERERRGDSRFGKTTEDRIVWSELIELELQEIDEQVSRIFDAAGRKAGVSSPSNLKLREGGSHERNDS